MGSALPASKVRAASASKPRASKTKPASKATAAAPASKAKAAAVASGVTVARVAVVDLAPIATALDAGDAGAALDAALVAWRTTRAASLAALIDALGEKLAAPLVDNEALFNRTARGRDATALGALLAAIPALPVSFLPQAAAQLAAFPDDPRLAHAIATWTHDPPTTSSSTHAFWTASLDALARIGDPRTVPILKSRLRKQPGGGSQFWPKLYQGVEKALPKIPGAGAVDEKAVAKLAQAAAKLAVAAPRAKLAQASDPTPAGPPLAQALAHLAADRLPAGIEAMCTAWRALGKPPAIADAIERATRLLPTWDVPLGATDKKAVAAWDAAFAADPQAAMPQLLHELVLGGPKVAERHLLDLAALPEDPRVAMRLTALCSGSTVSPERTQFWKSLLEQIARIADPRVANELCILFDEFTKDHYNHHRQARRILGDWAKHPPAPPALGPQETAALGKIDTALATLAAKRDTTEQGLVAAIVDAWDDTAPRLVYADWLSDRDHPRGEVIVLSCKATRTAAEEKRLRDLRKGTSNLYGVLESLSEAWYAGREFALDRGLPTALTVPWNANPYVWRDLVGYPLMAMVAEIVFEENAYAPATADLAAVLLDPTARRLARVKGVPQAYWTKLKPRVDGKWKQRGTALVRA